MTPDDHLVQGAREKRSASVPRRWPVRRCDLAVFVSAHGQKYGPRRVEDALEIEKDNSPEADAR
jgi:hypothetical protein